MKLIGKFEVVSGCIVAADPCYDTSGDAFNDLMAKFKAKNGTYRAYAEEYMGRIARLHAIHESVKLDRGGWIIRPTKYTGIGVDSGTMGIFDEKYHAEYHTGDLDETWYDENICENPELDSEGAAILDNRACVSSSGYGDGSYPVYVYFNGDPAEENPNYKVEDMEVCGVMVDFGILNDENEDEDYDDDFWYEDEDEDY